MGLKIQREVNLEKLFDKFAKDPEKNAKDPDKKESASKNQESSSKKD